MQDRSQAPWNQDRMAFWFCALPPLSTFLLWATNPLIGHLEWVNALIFLSAALAGWGFFWSFGLARFWKSRGKRIWRLWAGFVILNALAVALFMSPLASSLK